MRRVYLILVLALLVAGAILATIGPSDRRVNLSSVLALWSEALRDTDQVGMRLTRLSDSEEERIGAEFARISMRFAPDQSAETYVSDVGQSLLPYIRRRGIHYQFHVVESPTINAFALPGGQIFVTTSMLAFVQSEAELAAVLGHEIAHVDLRHCVERYQYQYQLKKAGAPELGSMIEVAHSLATMGFSRYQELDADAQGQMFANEAGYHPDAGAALFARMKAQLREPPRTPASTPAAEITQSAEEALGSYFETHPPFEERGRQLRELSARQRRNRQGRSFYVGRQNLTDRVARTRQEWKAEYRSF